MQKRQATERVICEHDSDYIKILMIYFGALTTQSSLENDNSGLQWVSGVQVF